MSHHLSISSANPTGAVEVVHQHTAEAMTSPVDGGSGTGGLAKPAFTEVAGQSGTSGANLPVDDIEQASNVIQRGKADLSATAGAERRLDGFDGVGGGGANNEVAAGTANENVSNQDNGLAAQQTLGEKQLTSTGNPDRDVRSQEKKG